MDLTDLTLNLQAARRLRPLLQGITGLLAVADELEQHQQRLLAFDAEKATIADEIQALRRDADSLRATSGGYVESAKAEAARLIADGLAQKERLIAEGKWGANRIATDMATRRADAAKSLEAATEALDLLRAEAAKVAADVATKKKELAEATQSIADARELMSRFGARV